MIELLLVNVSQLRIVYLLLFINVNYNPSAFQIACILIILMLKITAFIQLQSFHNPCQTLLLGINETRFAHEYDSSKFFQILRMF